MVPFLYFLIFAAVFLILAFVLTLQAMKGSKAAAGPARVAAAFRTRNRAILLFFLVLIILLPILEAMIPAVSEWIANLQYLVGDVVSVEPVLVYRPSTGTSSWVNIHWLDGTISWGFYLAILAGVFAGLVGGTLLAMRRYPVLRGVGVRDIV